MATTTRIVADKATMEGMLNRVLNNQQPFFKSVLNQMQAVEQRLHTVDTRVGEIGLALERIASAQLVTQIAELNNRIDILEKEQHKRQGMKELFDWAPKVIMVVGLILVASWGYLQIKNH